MLVAASMQWHSLVDREKDMCILYGQGVYLLGEDWGLKGLCSCCLDGPHPLASMPG